MADFVDPADSLTGAGSSFNAAANGLTAAVTQDPTSAGVASYLQQMKDSIAPNKDALAAITPNSTSAAGKPTFDTDKFISDAYQRLTSGISQAQQEVQQNQLQMQAASEQEQGAILSKADADQQVNAVKAAAEVKQKSDALASAAMFGTTPGATSDAISGAASQIQADLAEYTARDKDMQQRRQQGFLDDPVQWLVNRVVLHADQKLQDSTEQSMNAQQSIILKAQAATSGSIQIANATDAADAAKALDAINQGIRAKATQDTAESSMKLAQFGQQGIQLRDTLNTAQFSGALQSADFDVKKQELYLQQGYKTIQEQLLGLRLSEKAQTDADKTSVDTGLSNLGNFVGVPGLNLQQLKLRPADQKEAIDRMLGFGAVSAGGVLGANAGQVITDLNTINAQGGNGGMNYVRQKISDAMTAAMNQPMMVQKLNGKQLGQLPGQVQADITNQIINASVSHELASRPTEGGIYSPGPWKTTLPLINSAAPGLAAAAGPLIAANPTAPSDPQALVNIQLQRLKAGSISPAQAAAELSTSYRAINADIVQQRNLKQMAMRLPSTYNAAIKTDGSFAFGAKKVIDLASQASLQAYFTRARTDQRAPSNNSLGLGQMEK